MTVPEALLYTRINVAPAKRLYEYCGPKADKLCCQAKASNNKEDFTTLQVVQIERIILISKYLYNFHYKFAILSFREINPHQQL